jgi:hypothetical protein
MLVSNREKNLDYYEGRSSTFDFKTKEKEWTLLWKVKVPTKIKVFLWRLARYSLPSGDLLCHMNMAQTDVCVICGARDLWKHSLIECNMSKCVWALEKEDITDFIGALQEEDARAWLAKVLPSLPQEDMVRVVVTIWAIWHARRKAIHENLFQCPLSTHAFIDKFVSELGETTMVWTRERQLGRPARRWIPPLGDLAKINVDAAVSKNSGRALVATIARTRKEISLPRLS